MVKQILTNIVAGAVVKKDGKYLLIQENKPSDPKVHGKWNLPAGKVDEGGTIEQAAVREVKEEAGYNIELIRKIDIFQENADTPPKHAFEAKIIGNKLDVPLNETLEVKWFTWQEIQNMKDKLRSEWVMGAIKILENK